jgi:hypothetical protein
VGKARRVIAGLAPAARQLATVFAILGTPLLLVGLLIPMMDRYEARRAGDDIAEQAQAVQSARLPFEHAFVDRDPATFLAFCRQAIEATLPLAQWPVALHVSRDRVDAYYPRSPARDSLRRVSCRDSGLVEEVVGDPLAGWRPRGATAAIDAADDATAAPQTPPELWGAAQQMLDPQAEDAALLSIELLYVPPNDEPVQRITRRGGAAPVTETQPADAPIFASLSSAHRPPIGLPLRRAVPPR